VTENKGDKEGHTQIFFCHVVSQIRLLKREIRTKITIQSCLWKFCKMWKSLEHGERNGSVHKYPF